MKVLTRRHALLKGIEAAAVGMIATVVSHEARSAVGIEGREVRWRGLLPDGWFGGNAAHIEEVVRDPDFEVIRKPMEWLLSRAKMLDAAALHMDMSAIKSDQPSLIQISKGDGYVANIADAKQRSELWEKIRGILPEDAPAGSKTTLVSQSPAPVTGGFPTFAGIFRTDQPNGSSSFALFHCVDCGQGRVHMFELSADQVKFMARRQEFDSLLRSVRYL
jgi:hypothetical protein